MAQSSDAPSELTKGFENAVIHIEPSPRWVRGYVDGVAVVDTKRAVLLREKGTVPAYYIPMEDVRMDLMTPVEHTTHCPRKGDATYWSLTVGERTIENAAWAYPKPFASSPDLADDDSPDLRGYVAFYWGKIDAWFEEEEQVYIHAHDPYKRIDALPSSRHVRVEVGGETVAETRHPVLLLETGMPVRYYVPILDFRMDLLARSDQVTRCPYKGEANYHSIPSAGDQGEGIAWYYRYPLPEAAEVAGHVCFFNERVDVIYVDGEEQPRPQTRWSKR